ncbi:hypothetical protein STXM2123_4760 [Streptomyces sp. F-3]|nr:hypothetical protein STXM2123_4760 [Streptomyces sp. F-3]
MCTSQMCPRDRRVRGTGTPAARPEMSGGLRPAQRFDE